MIIFNCLALLLGGITIFMLGLRFVGNYSEKFAGEKMKRLLKSVTGNKYVAVGAGTLATMVAQSSVAVNMAIISFVNASMITLIDACAVVIGTNIGTTITAQLVSLSFIGEFNVTAIGALVAFCGLMLSFSNKQVLSNIGNVLVGFGLIFVGIEIMGQAIEPLKRYNWFIKIFSVQNSLLLILNGFFVTAICQSSSVVTSMLVVLAGSNAITFEAAMFMIMGANIGSCVAVIIVSGKKCLAAQQTAWFNLLFNIFGVIIVYILYLIFNDNFTNVFSLTSKSVTRQIANFHTLFNIGVGVIMLPILNLFIRLTKKLVTGKPSIVVSSQIMRKDVTLMPQKVKNQR